MEYDRQVDEYQEEHKMEYLSSMERRAMERGRQAGILEGLQEGMQQGELSGRTATVQRQLARRLGALSREDEQRIRSLSLTMLDLLADDLLDFNEPADLQRWFARYVT